jgi:hypothetical protein
MTCLIAADWADKLVCALIAALLALRTSIGDIPEASPSHKTIGGHTMWL